MKTLNPNRIKDLLLGLPGRIEISGTVMLLTVNSRLTKLVILRMEGGLPKARSGLSNHITGRRRKSGSAMLPNVNSMPTRSVILRTVDGLLGIRKISNSLLNSGICGLNKL
jgi:hypothetical protein